MSVYFWALSSLPLICVSVSLPVSGCFDYYSFVVYFEIREYDTSRFVLLSQVLLWIQAILIMINLGVGNIELYNFYPKHKSRTEPNNKDIFNPVSKAEEKLLEDCRMEGDLAHLTPFWLHSFYSRDTSPWGHMTEAPDSSPWKQLEPYFQILACFEWKLNFLFLLIDATSLLQGSHLTK